MPRLLIMVIEDTEVFQARKFGIMQNAYFLLKLFCIMQNKGGEWIHGYMQVDGIYTGDEEDMEAMSSKGLEDIMKEGDLSPNKRME